MLQVASLLAFERAWLNRPQHDGAKEAAIRERFGCSPTVYYQQLVAILDTREALEVDAVTVGVVRRRLARGQRQRVTRSG